MSELRAGRGIRDITPESPIQLSGYGPGTLERVSTGVHSPLRSTALVLDDGRTRVAVVSVDLLNVSRELTASVRERVADVVDHVFLAATHTHAAPYVSGQFLEVNPLLSFDADVDEYLTVIESAITKSIREASDGLRPAELRVGRVSNEDVLVNRRDAAGSIDPALVALRVTTADGDETLIVNFACHPVCTTARETLISSDWPGEVADRVQAETGAEVLILNGATGDVNPEGSAEPRTGEAVYEYMAEVGERIADTVLSARAEATGNDPLTVDSLAVDRETVDLPIQSLPPRENLEERYDELTAEIERHGGDEDAAFHELQHEDDPLGELLMDRWYVEEKLRLHDWGLTTYDAPISRLEIDTVDVLSFPGEVFARHGLDFRERATSEPLIVAGFVDDYVGYFPTVDAFDAGGYEVRTCKFSPEAIRRLRTAAFDLLS
ncbi:neutral/alkaline non-lysosomal ceramidase N-terminal domain-containing protein [Halorussus salinisoli]|uniref:neutral/alkaline non-lysosomal ceramidase N-terminal domain-containing protein n=1 Tax=Halorussus salinisoli TaxID=2558242 RepID=UPI0010C23B59|nr:neutral/alkaline non-lysosomal ceramidase N-terminal domain-containing protein [Halorussus salinisoli]